MTWIDVNDRMPTHHTAVLAVYKNSYGKTRAVVGFYLERWREESTFDDEWYEYHEDRDMYFLKEGWYEQIDNWGDYSSVVISEGEVTHWMELPQSPYGDCQL